MPGDRADRPTIGDPDRPSEAVGSWPSIDLARFGLPPLGWLFVAAALLVGAQRLRWTAGAPLETVPSGIFSAVEAVTIALLPAALLFRAREAPLTHRLLLGGLAVGAIAEFVRAVMSFWPLVPGGESWRGTVLDAPWPLLGPLGSFLVGLGLLGLRTSRPTRMRILAAIALAYVAPHVVSIGLADSQSVPSIDAYGAVLSVLWPVAAAFAVWVPVSSWLDGERPRAFWGLLALALPLSLVVRAFELPQAIAVVAFRSNALYLVGITLGAIVGAVVSLLALAAYAREMPPPARSA